MREKIIILMLLYPLYPQRVLNKTFNRPSKNINRVNLNPQAVAMVQKQFVKTGQIFFYREYHQAAPTNISFATCSKGLMRNSLQTSG